MSLLSFIARTRRSRTAGIGAMLVALCASVFLILSGGAFASHVYGTYGNRGYAWLARYYDVDVWVTSDYCNTAEVDAFTAVTNSTAGTTEFNARWPSGLRMTRDTCDGVVTNTIDISLDYSDFCQTHGCATHGGENHSTLAPSSWCSYWGHPYPCGSHPSVVHMNQPKFLNTSDVGRRRLIMHETGHSHGLAHHCSGDSIMNDGTSGCNGGRWSVVTGYLATDRQGILNVYPGWQYP
jgi:hypothetical protein